MRPDPHPHPRRIGPHIGFAIDMLTDLGATNIEVFKTRHLEIQFNAGPHRLSLRAPCTPENYDNAKVHIRQDLRRVLERANGVRP